MPQANFPVIVRLIVATMVVAVCCAPRASKGSDPRPPQVVEAVNDVSHQADKTESWEKARVGETLKPLDKVRTGTDSRAQVDTDRGAIRLYQNALLVVPDAYPAGGTQPDLQLRKGAGIFRLQPTAGGKEFRLRTNQIVLGVKGTTFSVITEGKELYQQEITRAIRSFAAMDLTGAMVAERWVDPSDGTVYSLVRLDPALVDAHLSRLGLSRPAGVYVRKTFAAASFRLETPGGR